MQSPKQSDSLLLTPNGRKAVAPVQQTPYHASCDNREGIKARIPRSSLPLVSCPGCRQFEECLRKGFPPGNQTRVKTHKIIAEVEAPWTDAIGSENYNQNNPRVKF